MLLVLYLLILLIGILLKKKKHFNILVILLMILIVFISIDCPDYSNYEIPYNYIKNGNNFYDVGFIWFLICKIGGMMGLTFRVFKTLIVFISLLLINDTVKFFCNKEKEQVSKFWLIYLIFPMLLDCIQFRFFLASSIVFFSFRFWSEKNIFNIIRCSLLILLACLIHSSCLFILACYILSLIQNGKKNNITKYIILTLLFSIFIALGREQIISFLSLFINKTRIDRYLLSGNPSGMMSILVNFIVILTNYQILSKNIDKEIVSYNQSKNIKYIYAINNINKLCFLILPLLAFDSNFIRIFRLVWILNIVNYIILQKHSSNIFLYKFKLNYTNFMILFALFLNVLFFVGISFDSFLVLLT
mgnify:CR=1 FL=1